MQLKKLYVLLTLIPLLILYQCTNQSEKTTLSSDGVEISFNVQGKGKPALVFIPGWTNPKTIWDDQVALFSEKYKVVTIDLAGHGESGNNRENWTISAFGDDVVAVIKKLKLKDVVLVGFSMGGQVVIEATKKVPKKVRGTILVDTMKDLEKKLPMDIVDKQYAGIIEFLNNPIIERSEGRTFKRNIEDNFNRIVAMYDGASTIGWKESLKGVFQWQNEESIESLKSINTPIIAINSDRSPTNIEAFRKYVPSFEVKIIKDTGHVVMWDAPDEFNQLLDETIMEFSK